MIDVIEELNEKNVFHDSVRRCDTSRIHFICVGKDFSLYGVKIENKGEFERFRAITCWRIVKNVGIDGWQRHADGL